jgi:pimeloyl-ACP methyl ester carboxylesterase
MGETTFVLVHGGLHGAWCWERLLPLLPGPSIAVDLPGRPGNPGSRALRDLRVQDFVDSVVHRVNDEALDWVVLVGHSMAGLTVPRVAATLGERVETMILVGAVVPPHEKCMIDDAAPVLRPLLRLRFTRQARRPDGAMTLPGWMAKSMFCNDMGEEDTAWVLENIVPDAPGIALEEIPSVSLKPDTGVGYVKMLRDKATLPKQADRCIARLERPVVREIDAGHSVMVSNPKALAGAIQDIRQEIGSRRP